jgi:hypothetical protein
MIYAKSDAVIFSIVKAHFPYSTKSMITSSPLSAHITSPRFLKSLSLGVNVSRLDSFTIASLIIISYEDVKSIRQAFLEAGILVKMFP